MAEISIIVPVYKAQAYLHSCIESILSQTYQNFELIMVDDGSPDSCGEICEEYAARDSRVHVIHQDNQGQAAARNHGLKIAQGTWVCFVDSDDLIHPQMIEMLQRAVKESGAPISMCQMLEAQEVPETFAIHRNFQSETLFLDEKTLVDLHDKDAYPSWVACAKLIRKDIVQTHLFVEGRVFEDNEAVCHWVYAGKTIAQVPYALYFYRTNPDSTTKSEFSLKKLDYLWALEEIIRFFSSIGYMDLRERFVQRYVEAAAGCFYGARRTLSRPEVARQIESSFWKFLRQQRLHLKKEQFEYWLDAAHPKLIRLYWPAEGVIRTVRKEGICGLVKKFWKMQNREGGM